MAQIEGGYLLIADIGGYTRYLQAVELDHAHDVLADLIGVVADTLGATFTVDKLEGDAVFAHRSSDASVDQLVELVKTTYFAFERRQRDIDHNTTCTCRACSTVPELDLKFVVHHGEFVEREMAGSRELVGADVIRVYRLLKNSNDPSVRAYRGHLGAHARRRDRDDTPPDPHAPRRPAPHAADDAAHRAVLGADDGRRSCQPGSPARR